MNAQKSKFDWIAFFLLTSIPLWFGMGQEIQAVEGYHDDYHFLLRSVSLEMQGNHLAPIKEIFYPLFIRVSRLYGLGLRNFEVICYGLSLFFLWGQISKLARSRIVAWLTLLPLALFSYQHDVFNRVTPDALALILLPLSFATSVWLYRKQADWPSSTLAGMVAGLHIVTRPEGVLFILPPMVSLLFVWCKLSLTMGHIRGLKTLFLKGCAVLAIVVFSQQVASAINWYYFGFWAPTIMKSGSFQRCSAALMKIDPGESSTIRYATVPKTSLEKAYQASPSFREARPYLRKNLDGHGWSGFGIPEYRATDGSISGGHFQWALLDAGASVSGCNIDAMLRYYDSVADEIDGAFERGTIPRRRFFLTVLGPNFSILDKKFWSSLFLIVRFDLNLIPPGLPKAASLISNTDIEFDFNAIALRRTDLLENSEWMLDGWVASSTLGIPDEIILDRDAMTAGITLTVNGRPDVVRAVCGLDPDKVPHVNCGIKILSPGSWVGNLRVLAKGTVTQFPLKEWVHVAAGDGVVKSNIQLQIDKKESSFGDLISKRIAVTTKITQFVSHLMRIIIFGAFFLLVPLVFFRRAIALRNIDLMPVFLVTCLATSVALPRLVLFAAIDANMYPGIEFRYLSLGSFSVWLFCGFVVSYVIISLLSQRLNVKLT